MKLTSSDKKIVVDNNLEVILDESNHASQLHVEFYLKPFSSLIFKSTANFNEQKNFSFKFYCEKESNLIILNKISACSKLRIDLEVNLNEENSTCEKRTSIEAFENNFIDYQSTINHLSKNTKSNQIVKGVAQGKSSIKIDGSIFIDKNLNKIDASLLSKNLILDIDSKISIKPELKILSHDVKCKHGATIGKLQESELFYLMTRGINKDKALAMLKQAFLKDVFNGLLSTINIGS